MVLVRALLTAAGFLCLVLGASSLSPDGASAAACPDGYKPCGPSGCCK